ncbi:hypothetical protein QBC41DRAFT_383677 [Cercophora samala]|uniref:Uncharacterized protein n=1 Tax=Cercophora samala TaxID=330535 RepID=A0AA39YXL5_9PEZI|nr:hypothetical protein QBC41DRAFT_383677 [Cercophora samala]
MATPSTSSVVLTHLWPEISQGEWLRGKDHYSGYSSYMHEELSVLMNDQNADFFALNQSSQIALLIGKLRSETQDITRPHALHIARSILPPRTQSSDERLMRSVDAAVRIWLTIDISSLDLHRLGMLTWHSTRTLSDIITSHFNSLETEPQRGVKPDTQQLQIDPESITADYLIKYHGYSLLWTNNLALHLTIDWKHRTITVYEHKIVLYNHLRFSTANHIIPDTILEEAIDTLNLLFPSQNDSTKRLLTKHKKPFYGLGFCNRSRKLNISDYSVWRSRVADLVFISKGPPVGIQQLRLDRTGENLLQFATFWIATAVGIFTLASIALGVASVVYSVKAYDIGQKQYQVAVWQFCLDLAQASEDVRRGNNRWGELCFDNNGGV